MGVDLFFVLSGFLIGSHLITSFEKQGAFMAVMKNYAPRRFFRIAPVYYVVLAAAVLGLFPFYPYPQSYEGIGWRVLYHAVFLQDYFPSDIVVVFWSLGTEIKFYLLAPFLIWGLLRLNSDTARVGVMAALVLSQPLLRVMLAPEVQGFEDYFFHVRTVFHYCLDGLLMGVMAAFILHARGLRALVMRKAVANALFWGGVALFFAMNLCVPVLDIQVTAFGRVWLTFFVALGFMAMLLGLVGSCWGHKVFEGRGQTFTALISYSLYLVHLPMIYLTLGVMMDVGAFDLSSKASYVISLPIFFMLSVALATLLYVFVEKPIIDWSKKHYQS